MQVIVNGQAESLAEAATVAALLEHLGLAARPVAVEVNLDIVPRAQHAEHRLREGDAIEVVTLVGGG